MTARCFTIPAACPGCDADLHVAEEPGGPPVTVSGHADDCPIRPAIAGPADGRAES